MKQLIVILFCLLMSSKMLWAGDGNHYDYTPKSPEAAAFDRVPDIPVSNYTGTLALSIPIYTITCGDIVLPISLDYQGGTIPVRQEATWVGLNWLLNAGGAVVTRIGGNSSYDGGVYYKEDWENLTKNLRFQQFHIDGGEFPAFSYKINGEHPDWCGDYGKTWFASNVLETGPERNSHGDLAHDLYIDIFQHQTGETPTFHASFMGNSITFVWDKIKREFLITGRKQNFRIEGSPTGMTITDGRGIKYNFYMTEFASLDGSDIDLSHTPKDLTLYLSSIQSPSGYEINFKYEDGGIIKPVYSVSETLYDRRFPSNLENYTGQMIHELKSNALLIRRLSHYYTINSKRLSCITTNTGLKIKFNASSSPRLDLNGQSYSLDNIEVCQNNKGGESVLKKYCFSYSYFDKNTIGGNTVYDLFHNMGNLNLYNGWFTSEDFMYKRLRLDSFWEEDSKKRDTRINQYRFYYYDGLPCKASAAVDYWGYYNGQDNARGSYHTMLPRAYDVRSDDAVYDVPNSMKVEIWGNRRPNADYARAGMLSGIIYPTGGTSTINYESNTFKNLVYFDKEVKSSDVSFGGVQIYLCNQKNYSQGSYSREGDSLFVVKHPGRYRINVSYYKNNLQEKAHWRNMYPNQVVLLKFENDTDNPNHGYYGSQALGLSGRDTSATNNITISQDVFLKKGTCRIMIVGGMQGRLESRSFYSVTARIDKTDQIYESAGAGVRVKSVAESDGKGNSTTTTYTYENCDYTSSGILMAPLVFAREKLLLYQTGSATEVDGNISTSGLGVPRQIRYWKVCNEPMSPNPSTIGYSRVVVKRIGNMGNNGEHVFSYWNNRWGNSDRMNFCKRVEDPRNGLLKSDSVFDASRSLVQATVNKYKWQCTDARWLSAVIENLYNGPNYLVGLTNPYRDILQTGCMQIYLYPSVQFSMLSSHQEVKEFKGKSQLESWKDVWYNQTNGLDSLSRFSQSESDNVVLEETYYPQDFMTKSNAKTLTASNITSVPMERIASVKNEDGTYVVKDSRTDYDASGNIIAEYVLNNGSVMPRNNFTLWKNSPSISSLYDNSATLSYNQSHRPREVRIDGAEVCTYIWGYYSQYPIAVVKGANFSMVANVLNGSSTVDDLESAATPSYSNKQLYALLSKLPGCLVTTYSYNPYVGMVEMIDNKGECTTYDYDLFARLSAIKDHDGIVSTAFKYNYKHY